MGDNIGSLDKCFFAHSLPLQVCFIEHGRLFLIFYHKRTAKAYVTSLWPDSPPAPYFEAHQVVSVSSFAN